MALELGGSKVLITGATSGIGRETAKLLAQLGCVVAITGRRQERLDELEKEIKDSGGRVFSFCGDLVDPVSLRRIVAGAADQLDGIDISGARLDLAAVSEMLVRPSAQVT